jgi:hypothetical protein
MKPQQKPGSITRKEFVYKFMRECGMSYVEACRAFTTMVALFEDGVLCGSRITIGRVGCLNPHWRPPREVRMGFQRVSGNKVIKRTRHFNIGSRISYQLRLYKKFMATHDLGWFSEM